MSENGAVPGPRLADASLSARLTTHPVVHDADRARAEMEALRARAAGEPELAALGPLLADDKVKALLSGILGASSYLSGLIERDAARLLRLLKVSPEARMRSLGEELASALMVAGDAGEAMRVLRRYKAEVALLVALADIGGVWGLDEVTGAIAEAADRATTGAVRFLMRQAQRRGDWLGDGDPEAPDTGSGYIVIAMGKHGARELNYSSDIDLIVFFDPALARLKDGLEPQTFFVRLTRDLVRLLQEQTADGYVFRTDLRLRPDPGATHVAISVNAALHYYESFGQNWERAALIKARPIAGDLEAGKRLLQDLAPFIWRKYLDFAAIADIHAMKRQIHAFKGFGEIGVAGHDIKVGRGGIREIEFFAQTQQLIAGGRQVDLRIPTTLGALDRLVQRGWLKREVELQLAESYVYLRRIEHRLQMLADEQTQTLPSDAEQLERLARFAGYPSAKEFAVELTRHLTRVQRHYAALFEHSPELSHGTSNMVFAGEADDPATVTALSALGFSSPPVVIATVRGWHHGRYPAIRTPRARELLTEVQPLLIEALAATADPDQAFLGFDRFLAQLPSGVQLFSLLRANPSLLKLVADIMGSAPRLARILGRRRRVLDAVLDPGFFGSLPVQRELGQIIEGELGQLRDFQEALDRARVIGSEQAFLIGVRLLTGTIGPEQAGGGYAALAEELIRSLKSRVEAEMAAAHGRVEGGSAVVLAMGKLGGREMTAASDLDLIVVYDHAETAIQSNGPRSLPASQYFARLTQRLISALTAPTAEGALYEVDMRLRPSGQKGPVATRLASFAEYQSREAWTWEHLALTRARVIAGPAELRARVEGVIRDVLVRPRDRVKIVKDVREMRALIAKEKGTTDIWDLKQVRGGLVDLEFIAQYLQLVSASAHPGVLDTGTLPSLEKLAKAGVLSPAQASVLMPAARLVNSLTQVVRLCLDGNFEPDKAPDGLKNLLASAGQMPDFTRLESTLKGSLQEVADLFDIIIA